MPTRIEMKYITPEELGPRNIIDKEVVKLSTRPMNKVFFLPNFV